jgi:hypothetical protein
VSQGEEADITFTPTQVGRYPITVDGAPGGSLVVSP